ncbi:MAG: transposase [Bryobacteraceae bacterium]
MPERAALCQRPLEKCGLAFHGSLRWLEEPRSFARFLHTIHRHKWVFYPKKPFGGPEGVLHYLARYTHRVAISNHRLIGMDGDKVTFRWKDNRCRRKRAALCRELLGAEPAPLAAGGDAPPEAMSPLRRPRSGGRDDHSP